MIIELKPEGQEHMTGKRVFSVAGNSHLPRCTLLLVTTLDKVHAGSASGTAAQPNTLPNVLD